MCVFTLELEKIEMDFVNIDLQQRQQQDNHDEPQTGKRIQAFTETQGGRDEVGEVGGRGEGERGEEREVVAEL